MVHATKMELSWRFLKTEERKNSHRVICMDLSFPLFLPFKKGGILGNREIGARQISVGVFESLRRREALQCSILGEQPSKK